MNGTSDQPISSGIDPVIGSPTFSPVSSRYLIAKNVTRMTTSSAKKAVTATMKKYRLSTSGARVDACVGKSGMPDSIELVGRRGLRVAAEHDEHERRHSRHGQHGARAHQIHHRCAVSTRF